MGCAPKNAPQIWGVCNTNGWPSNDQQLFGFVPVLDHSSQLSSGYPFGHSIRTSHGSPLIEVEHMALPFVHHEVWTASGEIQTKRLTNIQINIFQSILHLEQNCCKWSWINQISDFSPFQRIQESVVSLQRKNPRMGFGFQRQTIKLTNPPTSVEHGSNIRTIFKFKAGLA